MKTGNVRLASEDQMDELRISVIRAYDKLRGRLDSTTAQGWIGNSSAVDKVLEGLLPTQDEDITPDDPRPHIEILRERPKPCIRRTADEQIAGMEAMYKMLGWSFTTSGLVIPERRKGFDRLIVVGNLSLTNNCVYDACKASFPSWRYTNELDAAVPSDKEERHPNKNGIYAVWFRDRIEADEELKNLWADTITERDLKTITLLERELMECSYFMETEEHLDVNNVTLCAGSLDSGGNVPGVRWDGGRFYVDYYYPDARNPCLHSREAIVLEEKRG
ncbi:MAG: hypothetical protein Q8P52_02710 [bacterium]|nr:hypothetical protein [bacterium]